MFADLLNQDLWRMTTDSSSVKERGHVVSHYRHIFLSGGDVQVCDGGYREQCKEKMWKENTHSERLGEVMYVFRQAAQQICLFCTIWRQTQQR